MRQEMPTAACAARAAAAAAALLALLLLPRADAATSLQERQGDGDDGCECGGALLCHLRACAPPPDPPLARCVLHLARGSCCARLRCPEGVAPPLAALGIGVARLDDDINFTLPSSIGGGCIHGGMLYASGSAMTSTSACEHCYCVGGRRRCVRPTCLPPPPGCTPAGGAAGCCPARYRCARPSGGCAVAGRRYAEGAPVHGAGGSACDSCYCVRGAVRCARSSCAPPLLGCRPVLRRGECCPHSYDCSTPTTHSGREPPELPLVADNFITATGPERRAFPAATVRPRRDTQLPAERTTPASKQLTAAASPSDATSAATAALELEATTSQPEGSVRIVINGTINCTAEYSATEPPPASSPTPDAEPPATSAPTESYTFDPSKLITKSDEADTFTVNVSARVRTNTTAPPPEMTAPPNRTAKPSADYDYEYGEATLPPSLPNLKIIPFVAADAVVEDAPPPPPLKRADRFPVYFASAEGSGLGDYSPLHRPLPPAARPAPTDFVLVTSRATFDATDFPALAVTNMPTEHPSFGAEVHSVNRFSPPVETEGGFVPKWEMPLAGDYFGSQYGAASPAPPPPPPPRAPAINFDKNKECVSEAGEVVAARDEVTRRAGGGGGGRCARCRCTWGVLLCSDELTNCDDVQNATTPAPTIETSSVATSTSTPAPLAPSVTATSADPLPASPAPTSRAPQPETTHRTTSVSVATETSTTQRHTIPDQALADSPKKATTVPPTAGPEDPTTSPAPTADYDDTEEEDGGFSFGSVLKLLLSDSYDTTTAPPSRRHPAVSYSTAAPSSPPPFVPLPTRPPRPLAPLPTRPPLPLAPLSTRPPRPVVPLSTRPPRPIVPLPANPLPVASPTVGPAASNKSEHLVLGATSSIERRSERPATSPPIAPSSPETPPPTPAARPDFEDNAIGAAAPSPAGAFGGGILKLAGCNIYGRMYRVGRIIAELSSACRQCMCTELGVQCAQRRC